MTTRRPGRVQHIAYDATPLNAAVPDIGARTGWLLAMLRLHHRSSSFGDGRQFVAALADIGCVASRSLVSRWESGEIPISYEGMTAYEQALGLEPGRITSLTGYARAVMPGNSTKVVRPQVDIASREFAERLDELVDLAETGDPLAKDWRELGWHLSAVPLVHLRRPTWESLTRRLVSRLPRSIKVPYRLYGTAARNIALIPRAQEFMVDAIEDYLKDPDAQVITNPMGLLDSLPTRKSARIVLDMIESPRTHSAFRMAVWLAAQKLRQGDFTPEEQSRLDVAVLQLWRNDQTKASEELAELIANLSMGMRSTLTSAAASAGRRKLEYVVETAEELPPDKARRIAQTLAEGSRSRAPQEPAYHEDRMLPRLFREVLFHRDFQRRHLAALLISASPFCGAATDELLTLLDSSTCPPWVRARAATAVRYLCEDIHRLRMFRYVEDRDEHVATAITQGFGHIAPNELSDQALRTSLANEWSLREHGKMYALGMTGSPGLEGIRKSAKAPNWQKAAASWWLAHGPAVVR